MVSKGAILNQYYQRPLHEVSLTLKTNNPVILA